MDNGVPHTSKRVGARPAGSGVAKAAGAKASGPKQGPADPRKEDPSSPLGISRAAKTVWRRPGALSLRTAKHREIGSADAPIEFSATLPLASARTLDAETADTGIDNGHSVGVPTALAPTTITPEPTALVRTAPVPAELLPPDPRTAPVTAPVTEVNTPILYDEAATIDDVTLIGPVLGTRPLHRPIHFRRAPKPRVRRVTRTVRHIDTWSVFKVALVFNVFFYAVAMVAGVLLWQVAYATGTIDNVEKFFEGFGWETFKFNGGQIFHNAWIAGLFVAAGLTGLAVLLATMFNLITDLVGGIRLSVLEEEVHARVERGIELLPEQVPEEVVEDGSQTEVSDVFLEPSDEAIAG